MDKISRKEPLLHRDKKQMPEKILPVEIEDEVQKSYLDYAMSVIIGRALPDVRDGLKPVHRRILYAMQQIGNLPNRPHKKSARVVGEVLGKFHPHGDMAIYDTIVRMAQPFSQRYVLIDGHGNFGSIDGDAAAAMRYTEIRLAPISMELLRDLDKDTVDFRPNFDDSLKEPVVLPAYIPNLLINGSTGIAVGMATNIPPHNLIEVVDAIIAVIENPSITLDELMEILPGPDFPTGATIVGRRGIKSFYETGRGKIVIRAVANTEKIKKNKTAIVVTQLPYNVNKANLLKSVAELIQSKKITGITDLRDESDKEGIRVVFELKKDAQPEIVLNQLYKHTQLQITFGAIMLALVDNQPQLLTLRETIDYFLEHRKDVVIRKTKYELKKAEERLHIVEGLRIAVKDIDNVIKIIKSSDNVNNAKNHLVKEYSLSEKQADAILNMRLQRLTGLELKKLEEEYKELKKLITELKSVLSSEEKVYRIIKSDLLQIKEKYGDKRKTEIIDETAEFNIEQLIEEEKMAITVTHQGYAKRTPLTSYKSQRRGGVGSGNISIRENDFVTHFLVASTHDTLLFFTNKGVIYRIKAYKLPLAGKQAKGTAIVNFIPISKDEKITEIIPIRAFSSDKYLIIATKNGKIKKTVLSAFDSARQGLRAITLAEDDEVVGVELTDGKSEIIISTRYGMLIRFSEDEIRTMGRNAAGVKAITLGRGDKVLSMTTIKKESFLLMVSAKGKGKRIDINKIRKQHRGGKGLIGTRLSGDDIVISALSLTDKNEIMVITSEGIAIRQRVSEISVQGRYAKGVRIIRLQGNQQVVEVAKIAENSRG